MPKVRPQTPKRLKSPSVKRSRPVGQPGKPNPKLAKGARRVTAVGEVVRKRAEAEAAIAEARKSHERLREAIDILPQGIVFLDAEGRYILWNK
jgi:PAS domain-containing protein